jgi:UDP-3-O-[3-hydroxymyristoyl] N-acetylglucosamine deacetylase
LKSSIGCTGVGLHSGVKVEMTLRPAAPNTGIVFHRTDVGGDAGVIPARWDTVTDTTLCTTVGNDAGVKVATIEHLLAGLAGSGIDNVIIELDGPEVPVMDGSAAPFVFLVDCAGTMPQAAVRRSVRVLRPVVLEDGPARVSLEPSAGFSVGVEIDFDSAAISQHSGFFDLHNGGFRREICRARTFGFERDVERLWSLGFARGGSLDNAVVIGNDDEILNEGGLRYGDEFVRHKVLDTVGDLYLAGAPLLAHFSGVRPGHALNNQLLRRLFADETNWAWADQAPVPTTAMQVGWNRETPLRAAVGS